jgi:RNA polymerase sigma-70 factor, ECF subfamily
MPGAARNRCTTGAPCNRFAAGRVYPVAADRGSDFRVRGVSERELIDAVLAGDGRAERALYDAHVDRVFRLCYRLANGDHDRAQDFTQETFVRAFDRLAEFRGDAALGTWLHSIAVSVSLNGMRRVKRWHERETALDDAPQIAATTRLAEPDLKTKLKSAIAALPEHYRVVFVMYDMEGYTHDEIAATLDLPSGTSKARLSRARARLREALGQFAGEWAT